MRLAWQHAEARIPLPAVAADGDNLTGHANAKPAFRRVRLGTFGRGDRIRTCDFYVPNVALYQAELHPDGSRKE